jgi:hypothetical protein
VVSGEWLVTAAAEKPKRLRLAKID